MFALSLASTVLERIQYVHAVHPILSLPVDFSQSDFLQATSDAAWLELHTSLTRSHT